MNWITIVWSMAAAACLTLAFVHGLVWWRERSSRESLLFSISAVAAAVIALQEVAALHARAIAEYGEVLRWMHVPVAVVIVSLVWFIHFFLHSRRAWLAWLITGLRGIVLVGNFLSPSSATFREISNLRFVPFWGESIAVAEGVASPWRFLIHAGTLLVVLYVGDAVAGAWRRGNRRRAAVVGGAVLLAVLLAVTMSELMTRGIVSAPFIGPIYVVIVLAMAGEMSVELIRARQLARDLRDSQERMRLAARAAALEFWEWDAARDSVWWSGEAGRSADATTLDHYLQAVHPDDRALVREAALGAVADGGPLQAEFRVVVPDGRIRWMAAEGRVDRGEDGRARRLRGVSMDVTARRDAEAALLRERRELAHAQRVSAMGQLSSALTHELSQPLGAILRNAEAAALFLRRSPPDLEEVQAIVEDIRKDDQRAAAVIERMRALLKRREIHFESLDLAELVAQVADLLRTEIRSRHVRVRLDVPEGLHARGDRVHVQQVLLNLLLNSLDALEGQPDELRLLTIRAMQPAAGYVELAVADRGPGFPADLVPHVFEPFQTTKLNGTGLGLAISKTIVEAHGGRIWAEKNPQGGAVVRFALPANAETSGA